MNTMFINLHGVYSFYNVMASIEVYYNKIKAQKSK